jgi:hypothetical protein
MTRYNVNDRPMPGGSMEPRLVPEFRQTTSHGLSRRGPKMNRNNAGSFEKRDPNRAAINLPSRFDKS